MAKEEKKQKDTYTTEQLKALFPNLANLTTKEINKFRNSINKEFVMWYVETKMDEKQAKEFLAKGEKTGKTDTRVIVSQYTKYKLVETGEINPKTNKPKKARVYDESSPIERSINLFGAKKWLVELYIPELKGKGKPEAKTKGIEQDFLVKYL